MESERDELAQMKMETVVLSCTVQFKDYKQASSFKTSSVYKSEHSSCWCTCVSSLDLGLLAFLVPNSLAYAASPLPLRRRLPSAHMLRHGRDVRST